MDCPCAKIPQISEAHSMFCDHHIHKDAWNGCSDILESPYNQVKEAIHNTSFLLQSLKYFKINISSSKW